MQGNYSWCRLCALLIPITLPVLHSGFHVLPFPKASTQVSLSEGSWKCLWTLTPPLNQAQSLITAFGDPDTCVVDETVWRCYDTVPRAPLWGWAQVTPMGLHSYGTLASPLLILAQLPLPLPTFSWTLLINHFHTNPLFWVYLCGTQSKTEKSETYIGLKYYASDLSGLLKGRENVVSKGMGGVLYCLCRYGGKGRGKASWQLTMSFVSWGHHLG